MDRVVDTDIGPGTEGGGEGEACLSTTSTRSRDSIRFVCAALLGLNETKQTFLFLPILPVDPSSSPNIRSARVVTTRGKCM
jgi:hypothetical protein